MNRLPRHRTDDVKGQTNGRPLTVDNDRADMLKRWQSANKRRITWDHDAYARADQDSVDPLFDPLEQRGDVL